MHFSDSEDRALLVTHESLQIVDLIYNNVVKEVKKLAYPRYAKLSSCGTFFVASFTDSTVSLFDTRLGNEITKVIGVPLSTYIFVISGNGKKLLYGNNQQICLWNIITAEIEVLT